MCTFKVEIAFWTILYFTKSLFAKDPLFCVNQKWASHNQRNTPSCSKIFVWYGVNWFILICLQPYLVPKSMFVTIVDWCRSPSIIDFFDDVLQVTRYFLCGIFQMVSHHVSATTSFPCSNRYAKSCVNNQFVGFL